MSGATNADARAARRELQADANSMTTRRDGSRPAYYAELTAPPMSDPPERRVVDKIGLRSGRLVVIAPAPPRRKRSGRLITYWRVRCDCGNERDVKGQRLGGQRPTLSCGCLRLDSLVNDDPIAQVFEVYKRDLLRQRPHNKMLLSLGEFRRLVLGDCSYCGRAPHLVIRNSGGMKRNTIDRIDPRGDYVASNCTSACWPCNRMKRTFTAEEFRAYALRIADYFRRTT